MYVFAIVGFYFSSYRILWNFILEITTYKLNFSRITEFFAKSKVQIAPLQCRQARGKYLVGIVFDTDLERSKQRGESFGSLGCLSCFSPSLGQNMPSSGDKWS